MVDSYFDPPIAAFIVIPVLLAVALVCGTAVAWRRSNAEPRRTRRVSILTALATVSWMAITWALGQIGILRNWNQSPPPFGFFIVAIAAFAAIIAFSRLGRNLASFIPLWVLVAVQSFRLPLELAMHTMYQRGIMPRQMSYSGRNFDIITGITAIIVAVLVGTGRGGAKLIAVWNVLGLVLLINVVTIAILSTPRFRYFGNEHLNVWVTYVPFVWLPAVMVLAALAGHSLIFRALRLQCSDINSR